MSQYNFGNLESPLSGGTFINTHLEPWRDALHSSHKGNSRPGYAVGGTLWVNDTTNPWVLNLFDGADDIPLGTFNTTSNQFTPSNAGVGDMLKSDNLSGLTNKGTARSNLDLGSLAVLSSINTTNITDSAVTNDKIANTTIALGKLANITANSLLGNATGSSAAVTAITLAANRFLARNSTSDLEAKTITDFAFSLLDDADAAAARSTLGITGGSLVYLGAQTASNSSSLDFTSLITNNYDVYVFYLIDVKPALDGDRLRLRTSTNNGSSYDSAGYSFAFRNTKMNTTPGGADTGNSSSDAILLLPNTSDIGNASGEGIQGIITLINPLGTTIRKAINFDVNYLDASGVQFTTKGSGYTPSTSDVDAIRFIMENGNITSGKILMYGIKNS